MRTTRIITVLLAAAVLLTGGCTNWKKKYELTAAELENLKALYANCQGQQGDLGDCQNRLAAMNNALNDCRNQLATARNAKEEKRFDPGFAGENVAYDAAKGTVTVTLDNSVLFDSGRVTLKSSSKSRLDKIAAEIKNKYPDKEIYVVGHTDTDPIKKSKWADNWELSAQRALAVTRFLIEQKIDAKQLAAAGRGEFHPVSSNKAANRRVEIVVHLR